MATLSIITVCRNEAATIRETAESVVGQTCRDYEWIVKDGGSTDGTLDVLEGYRGRMAHFVSSPDAGVFDAMNEAALLARGRWLLFLNGGDALATPDVLTDMQPFLANPGDEVLLGSHLCVWRDDRLPVRKEPRGILGKDHFHKRTINHQSAFIGRRVFEDFGPYDVTFRVLADYDFFARAVLGGTVIRCIPNLVVRYDMVGMSAKMRNSRIMRQEHRRIRRRYPLVYRVRRFFSDMVVACRDCLRSGKNGNRGDRPQ